MSRSPLLPALAAVLTLAGAAACGSGGDDEGGGSGGAAQTVIEIVETEFALAPSSVTIDEPGTYTFRAVNEGGIVHALEIDGPGLEEETRNLEPGDSAELTVEITEPGEYELYCPVDGHREQGMEGSVRVGGGAGAGTTTDETTTEESDEPGYGYG